MPNSKLCFVVDFFKPHFSSYYLRFFMGLDIKSSNNDYAYIWFKVLPSLKNSAALKIPSLMRELGVHLLSGGKISLARFLRSVQFNIRARLGGFAYPCYLFFKFKCTDRMHHLILLSKYKVTILMSWKLKNYDDLCISSG